MAKDGHDHRPGLKGRTEANQLTDSSQGPSTSRRACKALDYPAEPGEKIFIKREQGHAPPHHVPNQETKNRTYFYTQYIADINII